MANIKSTKYDEENMEDILQFFKKQRENDEERRQRDKERRQKKG